MRIEELGVTMYEIPRDDRQSFADPPVGANRSSGAPRVRRGRLRRLRIIGGRRATSEFPPPMENLYSVSNRVESPKSRFMGAFFDLENE